MHAQGAGRRKKEVEGGRKRKEEKENGKKEKKRKRREGGRERETAGPNEHARWSGSTQRVVRNEGEQGDGMVIDTGVGTADRRERFREIRGLEKI